MKSNWGPNIPLLINVIIVKTFLLVVLIVGPSDAQIIDQYANGSLKPDLSIYGSLRGDNNEINAIYGIIQENIEYSELNSTKTEAILYHEELMKINNITRRVDLYYVSEVVWNKLGGEDYDLLVYDLNVTGTVDNVVSMDMETSNIYYSFTTGSLLEIYTIPIIFCSETGYGAGY